jgi:flagellar hook-associated protein 3 FlgL
MTVGNALFNRLAIQGFTQITGEVGAMQGRIASGVNDPRPSADPARAAELSALRDLRARLDTRDTLAEGAASRLALTDEALSRLSENTRQLQQIALRAANDTLTGEAHAALRTEALMIRESLLAIANSSDSAGRPLFAGTGTAPAFEQTAAGVVYRGDDGAPLVQLGDRHMVATGLPGSEVFGTGPTGIFAAVDDMIASLTDPILSSRSQVSVEGPARLDLLRTREASEVEMTLTGPLGSVRMTLDMRLDAPEAPMQAINTQSAMTGISAVMESDGTTIRLVAAGEISIGAMTGGEGRSPALSIGPVDASGNRTGAAKGIRPEHLGRDALVARSAAAVEHLAATRASAGVLAESVEKATASIASQRLTVDQAVAGLEDLDVAATITRLQSLLLTQQAAQQSFVKISGQSLFNYLR